MITDISPWCNGPYILAGKGNVTVKFLSCTACDSQTRAAQAYHDQNLESSLGFILICRVCLPGMLANIHVYILTVVAE